jgi:nucleotide-binding universal stress UspA family protein
LKLPVDTLLVPVDFSEMSLAALDTAKALVSDEEGLNVVHVLSPIIASEPGVIWGTVDDASRKTHAREALEKSLQERNLAGAAVHIRLSDSGNAAWEIVQLSGELGAELIVLPSHGRHGLSRLAIGSVAERVVRYAHCPVLVLRG